jgi:hypothetical protein
LASAKPAAANPRGFQSEGIGFMKSIVREIKKWVKANRESLEEKGLSIQTMIPTSDDEVQWKGSIEIEYNGVTIRYTASERTIFQTELLVIDASSKDTLQTKDNSPPGHQTVQSELDQAVMGLLSGAYRK